MDITAIKKMKDDVSESFSGLSSGVNGTISEFSHFITMMDPYIEYFFSGGKGANTFIGDIVIPSESNLAEAMESAVAIMHGDSSVHDSVSDSLMKVLSLKSSIESIIAMLESITTYSVNTIIMSAKAGHEGKGLAAISEEMAQMSQNGSILSSSVTEKMALLLASVDGFKQKREQIEMLHENSLTLIHLSSKTLFKGLLDEFTRLSGEVLSDYAVVSSVQESMKRITEKFQHEDIVRQNFEKILYAQEEFQSGDFSDFKIKYNKELPNDLFRILSEVKMKEIAGDIDNLRNQLSEALSEVISVLDAFSSFVSFDCRENKRVEAADNSEVLELLYNKLERLKTDFENYINGIISKKKEMYDFLCIIRNELSGFAQFFEDMIDISGMFKTIIVLTQIELSRHDSLNSLLGGALSDVSSIPDRIKAVVSEGRTRFNELSVQFENSLNYYDKKFKEQKALLEKSIKLVRDISVQVFESKKYHNDFLTEAGQKICNVRNLIADVNVLLSTFSSCSDELNRKYSSSNIPEKNDIVKQYGDLLKSISDYYSDGCTSGDYKCMMLVSLISEMRVNGERKSVEFF